MWWLNDSNPETDNRQESPSQENIDQVSDTSLCPQLGQPWVGLLGVTRVNQAAGLGESVLKPWLPGSRCNLPPQRPPTQQQRAGEASLESRKSGEVSGSSL